MTCEAISPTRIQRCSVNDAYSFCCIVWIFESWSLDDVVHHLIQFSLALTGSELWHHVLLVLQRPLLHLRLVLLLFHHRATHVVHTCWLPFHNLPLFHHSQQVLSGKSHSLLSGNEQFSIASFYFFLAAWPDAFHLIELQDLYLIVWFLIGTAHCCYYNQPIMKSEKCIKHRHIVKSHWISKCVRNGECWSL